MDKLDAIERACGIVGIAYRSIGDYSHKNDCFCHTHIGSRYQNAGFALDYVEQAVREKLTRDGYKIREIK